MIIDKTYFLSGELFIPNIVSQNAVPQGQSSRADKMDVFISKYSRELLLNALGVDLFNELKTILDANTLEELGNEKWKALVQGEDYTTLDGKKVRFDGLEGYENQSMIAYYVFCKYLRDNDITYTTVGTVRDVAKNSFSVSATPKYVDIWNAFITMYQGKKFDGEPKLITNPAGLIGVSYYSEEDVQRSLYRYLYDKNEIDSGNFPDFEFKFYKRHNSMGI